MGRIREKNEQRNKLFGQPLVIFLEMGSQGKTFLFIEKKEKSSPD